VIPARCLYIAGGILSTIAIVYLQFHAIPGVFASIKNRRRFVTVGMYTFPVIISAILAIVAVV
jgi:hypothetical protein